MEEPIIREIRLEDAQAIEDIRAAISPQDADVDFLKLVKQQASDGNSATSLVAELKKKS